MAEREGKLRRTAALAAAVAALSLLALAISGIGGGAGAAGSAGRAPNLGAAQSGDAAPQAAAVTVDLCARTGSITMPDSTVVTIWGLALGTCVSAGPASVPGPTIEVNTGDVVTINLDNSLAESVALQFPGQDLVPDTVGAAPGGTTAYTFTTDQPGAFLYESGTNSQVQTAMGLFGALIVRPATPGTAYDDAGTAFDTEAILVLSEVDPALNNSPNPNTFNFLEYDPQYFLMGGKAYPETAPIVADVGETVLMRYLNAGLMNHTMNVLGLHQQVIGQDGNQLNHSYDAVAVTVGAGQTFDTLATIPATVPGSKFPVYSGQLHLTNVNAFPGGMLTFLTVPGSLPPTPPPPTPAPTPGPPTPLPPLPPPNVFVDFCAKPGSLTMPDTTVVNTWGLALGACATAGPATVPGPAIDLNVGDVVSITLENSLAENVGLQFPGQQNIVPDTTGAAPGGTTTYIFMASNPGTFLYESGTNTRVQVPMGLFGALVVRPALAGAAYEDAATAFDKEAVLVLSEVDPNLNNSIDPNTFNFLDYDPQYFLINGKTHPDTAEIVANPADRVLMRYVNAGVMNHTMNTLGFHQQVIGQDGHQLNFPHEAVSLTVATGQTFDVVATVPAADPGSRFPIYSGQWRVTNVNTFPGGMLTFLTVSGILSLSGDCRSPATMTDALTIAQYVVGLRNSIQCARNADVNGDGRITILDALTVARHVLGLD